MVATSLDGAFQPPSLPRDGRDAIATCFELALPPQWGKKLGFRTAVPRLAPRIPKASQASLGSRSAVILHRINAAPGGQPPEPRCGRSRGRPK